jgi:hypothetical protein
MADLGRRCRQVHGWTNLNGGSLMAFVMMGAVFDQPPNIRK